MIFDITYSGWLINCPDTHEKSLVHLSDFRGLERLAGAETPPIYKVISYCHICEREHFALASQDELDYKPLHDLPPVAYDVVAGKNSWSPELWNTWESKVRGGKWHWPLQLQCQRCGVQPTWPSLLRHIEPLAMEALLVSHRCVKCEQNAYTQIAVQDFHYPRL